MERRVLFTAGLVAGVGGSAACFAVAKLAPHLASGLSITSNMLVFMVPGTGFLGWPALPPAQEWLGLALALALTGLAAAMFWWPRRALSASLVLLGVEAAGLVGALWFFDLSEWEPSGRWGAFFGWLIGAPVGAAVRAVILVIVVRTFREIGPAPTGSARWSGAGWVGHEADSDSPRRGSSNVRVPGVWLVVAIFVAAVGVAAATYVHQATPRGPDPGVLARVPVGSYPLALAIDTSIHRVYSANFGGATVSVIDTLTNQVIRTISVGEEPLAIIVDPDSHAIYVANAGDDTVSVIRMSDVRAIASIPVGDAPHALAIDPTTHTLYVANAMSSSISAIDTHSLKIRATIPDMGGPIDLAFDPNTHLLFAAHSDVDTVSVIDAGRVTATISTPGGPKAVAVDEASKTLFVACDHDHLLAVDPTSGTVRFSKTDGKWPDDMVIDPNAHTLYISDPPGGTEGQLTIITGDADAGIESSSRVTTIELEFALNGIVVDPTTGLLYGASPQLGSIGVFKLTDR